MRRRRKLRRKNKFIKAIQALSSKIQNKFENEDENTYCESRNYDRYNCTFKIAIPKQNVSTQTELIVNSTKVYKDVAFQFPERKQFTSPSHNITRQICFCRSDMYSIRCNKNTTLRLSTKTRTRIRNILLRLRNETFSVSKLLLYGFTNKLSTKIEENEDKSCNDDKLNEHINSLKQFFLDEFTKINNRLDCIETNQKHLENLLETSTKANSIFNSISSTSHSTAVFVPPPPPPMPSVIHIPCQLTQKTISKIDAGSKKRSLSDISVSSTTKQINNERIAITVEDLRNVKLRSRAKKETKKQPFISEQMLNGVKLKPTTINVTVTDSVKIAPLVRSIWKYNTL